MAADVSSLVRVLSGYSKDDQHGASAIGGDAEKKSSALITRDLLGGAGSPAKLVSDAQELDLDLQVPCGWEKRLDLKVNSSIHCFSFRVYRLSFRLFVGNLVDFFSSEMNLLIF